MKNMIAHKSVFQKQPMNHMRAILAPGRSSARNAGLVAAGVVFATTLFLAATPVLVAAVGSVTLSIVGIPQILRNFKAGREGVEDLAISSSLIWFAVSVLLSVVSIGRGASFWWNTANLAGVVESATVVGQINYLKRDRKAIKMTLLTLAAVLTLLPLIVLHLFMPLSTWLMAAFTVAMCLVSILSWPQIRQNYLLYKMEGRAPKGIAPLYPALVVAGSAMHLFAALMGGDLRWAITAIISILTAGMVLAQVYLPCVANAVVAPLISGEFLLQPVGKLADVNA